ncbi:hypothetical protein Bbelb_049510 [Branchiostoma belcheri]|nr:hypothetical protein Bbelb_049510 [Branchiostoma belcheri]
MVQNSSKALMWEGLCHLARRHCVREGDGPANSIIKYFSSTRGFLPARLRHDLTWNRTGNIKKGPDRDVGLDLINEFLNNDSKGSKSAVDRVMKEMSAALTKSFKKDTPKKRQRKPSAVRFISGPNQLVIYAYSQSRTTLWRRIDTFCLKGGYWVGRGNNREAAIGFYTTSFYTALMRVENNEVRLVEQLPPPNTKPELVKPRIERLDIEQFEHGVEALWQSGKSSQERKQTGSLEAQERNKRNIISCSTLWPEQQTTDAGMDRGQADTTSSAHTGRSKQDRQPTNLQMQLHIVQADDQTTRSVQRAGTECKAGGGKSDAPRALAASIRLGQVFLLDEEQAALSEFEQRPGTIQQGGPRTAQCNNEDRRLHNVDCITKCGDGYGRMKVKTAEGDERVVSLHRVMFLTSDLPSLTTSMHVSHLCKHKHLSYELSASSTNREELFL